jgi:GT2 family glycosyltransferase
MPKKSYLGIANEAMRAGDYDEAIKNYIEALDEYEANPNAEVAFVAELIASNMNYLQKRVELSDQIQLLLDRVSYLDKNNKAGPQRVSTKKVSDNFEKPQARQNKNLESVDAKWKLGDDIDFNFEGVKKFGNLLVIHGWMVDPNRNVDFLGISIGPDTQAHAITDQITRFKRADVEVAFKRDKSSDLTRCFGFVVVVSTEGARSKEKERHITLSIGTSSGKVFHHQVDYIDMPLTDESLAALFGIIPHTSVTSEQCDRFYRPLTDLMINTSQNPSVAIDKYFDTNRGGTDIGNRVPELSIIVPLYGPTRFEETQIPVMAAWGQHTWEIIFAVDDPRIHKDVVQNVSRLSKNYGLALRVVAPAVNQGFAGINNFAASLSRGRNILFLNSDCFITDVTPLRKALQWLKKKSNGMVGFRLLYSDNSIQHDGMTVSMLDDTDHFYLNDHPRMGVPVDLVEEPSEADAEATMLTAACLMVRRDVFDSVSGFDRTYFRGDFEDSDLCLKVISSGKRLGIVRQVGIYHLERQTIRSQQDDVRQKITLINSNTYSGKWHALLSKGLPLLESVS